jgi:2-haloacid dehalogenase
MAKNAGLPWDCVLSSELAKHYKPDKEVYQTAADLLGLQPEQLMIVAAHKDDLYAARTVGFKTAFVVRPLEFGPEGSPDLITDPSFDVTATDFIDLADRLNA